MPREEATAICQLSSTRHLSSDGNTRMHIDTPGALNCQELANCASLKLKEQTAGILELEIKKEKRFDIKACAGKRKWGFDSITVSAVHHNMAGWGRGHDVCWK